MRLLALILLAVSISTATATIAMAEGFETPATKAVLIDVDTRSILFDKNSQERMPTSSMSKVMTIYMVFDALKAGRMKMDDLVTISENSWRIQGSKMFVPLGGQVKVEDLIRGVIIQSGNDAAVALAEAIAGSEGAFAEQMNKKALELGMKNSHFMNASGWPDPDHYSTCYDLALLAYHMIKDFPEYYKIYSEKEFTFNNIKQGNRNPLLYRNIGADGVKTGHTEDAGYGLIGTAVQNGRRLIMVFNGLDSMQARADESVKLLEWGFRNFQHVKLYDKGAIIDQAKVWFGQQPTVAVIAQEEIKAMYKVGEQDKLKVSAVINEPIQAPVKAGQEIGVLKVVMGDFPPRQYKLYAGADVAEMGFFDRMIEHAKIMFTSNP
ncbi:MAG TPA: D-alanyl-D-alanine carboxypeptidase family protein [Alphaproteobacteria bacterium]